MSSLALVCWFFGWLIGGWLLFGWLVVGCLAGWLVVFVLYCV